RNRRRSPWPSPTASAPTTPHRSGGTSRSAGYGGTRTSEKSRLYVAANAPGPQADACEFSAKLYDVVAVTPSGSVMVNVTTCIVGTRVSCVLQFPIRSGTMVEVVAPEK